MAEAATSVVSLSQFTWPTPPPSPPGEPPLPPPERRFNKTADQLECLFEQGIDLYVSSSVQRVSSAAHAVDNQQQCCALCAMRMACTRFVYIPGSGVCALVPHVPKLEIMRVSNPATVAGTVFLARAEREGPTRHHASCVYEVGYGYAKGALGAGRPLDEPQITSQQACCDACERNPECVKFVFEKYGGGCQLFESFSEKYKTPGLIAGKIPARLALGYSSLALDPSATAPPPAPPMEDSPAPPTLGFSTIAPPPFLPPDVGGAAEQVLAYASLAMGAFMVVAILLCTYCFYFGEIQGLLHKWSRGRYGKAQFSLLPKSLQDLELASSQPEAAATSSKKKKKKKDKELQLLSHRGPPAGHAAVSCETENMTQKKNVDIAGCASLDELQQRIWEEFGAVLKTVRQKDTALFCWVPTMPGDESEGDWRLLTKASDIAQVIACTALKLSEKKLIDDLEAHSIAFAPEKKKKASGRVAQSKNAAEREEEPADAPSEPDDAAPPKALQLSKGKGVQAADEHDGESSEASEQEVPDANEVARRRRGRRGRNVRSQPMGWVDEELDVAPASATDGMDAHSLQTMKTWHANRSARRPSALDIDAEAMAAEMAPSNRAGDDEPLIPGLLKGPADDGQGSCASRGLGQQQQQQQMAGRRVRMQGLKSMSELNGRLGTVVDFDRGKERFRVRLDDANGAGKRVLAFKAANLDFL